MEQNSAVPRTAVNQAPGGGTDYPFTSGSTPLVGVVLDFYLSYADPTSAHRLPFTLTVDATDYAVTDADGGTVASAAIADAEVTAWGTRDVYGWADAWVMKAVVRGTPAGAGVLDPRTCNRVPPRVTALVVGLERLTGTVVFEAGYNVDLVGAVPAEQADGGRFVSRASMDAVPGAGLGRLGGCDEVVPEVRRINGQGPDCGGNFVVEFDPCFRGSLPLAVAGDPDGRRDAAYAADGYTEDELRHSIRITSDCRPCCDCDMYVYTYRGLSRVWDKWQQIATRASAARDTYHANRDRWLASGECRAENASQLDLKTGVGCKAAVGGGWCNASACCVTQVELRFTFQLYVNGVLSAWTAGSPVDATISSTATGDDVPYAPAVEGGGQVVRFFTDYVDPQSLAAAKFRMYVPGCTAEQTLAVTLTVHAPDPAGDCTLPTPDVPQEILDVWTAVGTEVGDTVRSTTGKPVALNPNAA